MGADLRISSEPMAQESDAQFVRDGLSLYNVARTGYDHWRPLKLFVRDATGLIRGGLLGHIWGGWLHITDLWLEESARASVSAVSMRRRPRPAPHADGCRYVHLDSHTFQAPEFYKRLGYEEFGRLSDSPLGHEQVFLWRRI